MARISIIIPTYNEAKYIEKTLASIRKQGRREVEVILADNGSDDGTRELARKAYPGIKISIEKQMGIGRSCNRAARIASGELFLFIDGDTAMEHGTLDAYARCFDENRDIVAATGPIRPLEKTTSGIRLGFWFVSVGLSKFFFAINKPSIIGSNFAVRSSAFRKVHGFDPKLQTYQDWDLSKRLSAVGRIAYLPEASVRTSVRRVKKWGMARYFAYHLSNVISYNLFHRARSDYEFVR